MIGQTTDVPEPVRYLSLAWIDELTRQVAASEQMHAIADRYAVGFTQVVTDGPEGEVAYHLVVGDGVARFGAGPADPEDARFEQSWQTSSDLANGDLNANTAFINGHIRMYGDQQKVLDSQPVFGALAAVFERVHEYTLYE